MTVLAVGHAADDGVLVGHLGQLGEQLADADPLDVRLDGMIQRPGVVVARLRLGIEGVGVGRPAGEPDLDHRLGLGRGRGGGRGRLGVGRLGPGGALRGSPAELAPREEPAQAHRPALEQLAAETAPQFKATFVSDNGTYT